MIAIDLKHLNVLVLEDDIKYASIVNTFLNELEVRNIEIAHSYEEAIDLFTDHAFDILIADINLGEHKKNGDDFVRFLRRKQSKIPVIYMTSHYEENFYKRVKDTLPTSFLDKNISLLALRQAIELSLNKNYHTKEIDDSPPQFHSENHFIKIGSTYKMIKIEDISYFFAKDKAIFLNLEGRNYPVYKFALKELEVSLAIRNFVRVHKTYLVNLKKITSVDTQNHKLLIGEQSIPIGYVYRKKLFDQLTFLR